MLIHNIDKMAGKKKKKVTPEENAFWDSVRMNLREILDGIEDIKNKEIAEKLEISEGQFSNHLADSSQKRSRPIKNILFGISEKINVPVHQIIKGKQTQQEIVWESLYQDIIKSGVNFKQVVDVIKAMAKPAEEIYPEPPEVRNAGDPLPKRTGSCGR